MIGLDSNVLARYFVQEAEADAATQRQREAACQLIESGQDLFLPKSVVLELAWVLRGHYGSPVEQVLQVLEQMLHHASCRGCEAIASFDESGFARRIRQLNLPPRVVVPYPGCPEGCGTAVPPPSELPWRSSWKSESLSTAMTHPESISQSLQQARVEVVPCRRRPAPRLLLIARIRSSSTSSFGSPWLFGSRMPPGATFANPCRI
jgi:hypothetical protein